MSLQVPVDRRRKLSFPATLHRNLLGLPERRPQKPTRRRFSESVSRKLSSTIGWRSSSIPTEDIVEQGKTLCGQYIRCRLKRSNMFSRKCGLQRLRSAASLPVNYVVREVFPELLSIGQELERMHPELYTGVGRQASCTPVLTTEKAVTSVLTGVARELALTPLTWAKIVSLYAVAGGLATDIVRQGHPEFLQAVVEAMGEALQYHFADWISQNGGWLGLLTYCASTKQDLPLPVLLGILATTIVIMFLVVFTLHSFGRIA